MITFPDLAQVGRLGNQLWQIAATIGIGNEQAESPRFPTWDYRPYFQVPDWLFGDLGGGTLATEFATHLDPRARSYLQDYSLFVECEPLIRRWFMPSDVATEVLDTHWAEHFEALERPLVSAHVRRGDNVTHPLGYHPLRSLDYYRTALQERPGTVVVFTDDVTWCREYFEEGTGRPVAHFFEGVARPREYVDRQLYEDAPVLDWVDLQLMARCDSHIISNSTYAWWGAFLSVDPEPIYPSNWFGWRVSEYTNASLMFPSSWRQVEDRTEGGVTC